MRLTRVLLEKRRRLIFFNNFWHAKRDRPVKNMGFKEAVMDRGIPVYKPEDIFTPYLPPISPLEHDYTLDEPVKEAFQDERSHPFYHERPALSYIYSFNPVQGFELNIAKSLTKTVEISSGLPSQIVDSLPKTDVLANEDDLVKDMIHEVYLCDSTQKKLPRRVMVPYIGWHPVNSKMSSRVPYEVTHSYQRPGRREYGIPVDRRNMNLMRGMFRYCDFLSADHPALLQRYHLENCVVRQFFERDGHLTRIYMTVPFLVTGPNPMKPFASADEVARTASAQVQDISPMGPHVNMVEKNVYRHENTFPILNGGGDGGLKQHSAPNVHIGVELYNAFEPNWNVDQYLGRSLTMSFLVALGQARLNFGADVVGGVLPQPITTQFIATDGKRFCFSAFQLNTLDLDSREGVKNIFWHQEMSDLFEVCDNVKAVPTLSGYNPEVFKTIVAMYLQNS